MGLHFNHGLFDALAGSWGTHVRIADAARVAKGPTIIFSILYKIDCLRR